MPNFVKVKDYNDWNGGGGVPKERGGADDTPVDAFLNLDQVTLAVTGTIFGQEFVHVHFGRNVAVVRKDEWDRIAVAHSTEMPPASRVWFNAQHAPLGWRVVQRTTTAVLCEKL